MGVGVENGPVSLVCSLQASLLSNFRGGPAISFILQLWALTSVPRYLLENTHGLTLFSWYAYISAARSFVVLSATTTPPHPHLPTPTSPLRNSALLFPCHTGVVGTLYPQCTNTYWSNCPSLFLLWCLGSWMNIRQICWGVGYQTLLKDLLHLIKFHSSLVIYFSLLGPHKRVLHHFTLSSTPWFLQCTLAPKDTTLCVMGKTNFPDCILTFPQKDL